MTATVPTQDYASSVQGLCLRATRLNSDGTIAAANAQGSYVMDRFVSLTYTPVFEGGTDISLQGANGAMLVSYQTKDVLVRADISGAVADPDPQFQEIIAGGTVFVDNTIPASPVAIGWAPAATGTVSNPNGCALEIWSQMIKGNRRTSVNQYNRYVFPRCYLDITGDHTFENGVMGQAFSGHSDGNTGFGTGPDATAGNSWLWTSAQPYQHARVATAPTGINGYVATV